MKINNRICFSKNDIEKAFFKLKLSTVKIAFLNIKMTINY